MSQLGIILAGGRGTRLYPATLALSKQLLPVYDKPMVYYPLTTLMESGLRDLLVITTPQHQPQFQALLGSGEQWGVQLQYAAQPEPGGIAQALLLAAPFLQGRGCTLILGDNIFHGPALGQRLRAARHTAGATIFTYPVSDPQRYGVVAFGPDGRAAALLEKPPVPPSNQAVTGLYVYDGQAPALAAQLVPSARGELEITDLNAAYLRRGSLNLQRLGRGYAWLDAGTHDSLLEASAFVQTLERRQTLKIGSPEEAAYRQDWIGRGEVQRLIRQLGQGSSYAQHLQTLLDTPPELLEEEP
ncbi:glucose-1-phosphate thymidylyltransferase RfbA [Deinococcus sp. Marseille-Q6407]|uniref:glucose-1-phosphate thymidylyltransferase RfbA n=1 Tax=Deinococcus sp. Marseille-Q6407 TaxID=2969223 RepID=UPI0021BF063B|nr:glucose-1-phosphate thymidylyltransferase RfbA [Deinococcus sp. Marseille-Q6407]